MKKTREKSKWVKEGRQDLKSNNNGKEKIRNIKFQTQKSNYFLADRQFNLLVASKVYCQKLQITNLNPKFTSNHYLISQYTFFYVLQKRFNQKNHFGRVRNTPTINTNPMKYFTCILTYLSYSSLHTLRMCYSFNKLYIKEEFEITDFYLGVLDALVYISLGVGTLMRYTLIRDPLDLTTIYFVTSIFAAMSIALISMLGLYADYVNLLNHKYFTLFKLVITFALVVFGFMQLTSRPIATALVADELDKQQNGCLIGAWATHCSAGHISGLLLSNLLVHTLKLKWQVSILVGGIFCISAALLVYFCVQNPIQKRLKKFPCQLQSQQAHQLQQQMRNHSSRQFYQFIKIMLKSTNYKYYLSAYTIIKAMVYTFLLWFPIYLDSVKLKEYSGYITILFEIGAILGSFFLGKLYDYQRNKLIKTSFDFQLMQYEPTLLEKIASAKSLISMISMTIIVTIFIFTGKSLLGYCIFSFLVGFFLGGTSNTLSSNDIFKFSKGDMRKIDYLTNFNIGLGSCFVGLIQLIVGFALYEENQVKGQEGLTERRIQKSHHSYSILFIILLGLGVVVSILFTLKLFVRKRNDENNGAYDIVQLQ